MYLANLKCNFLFCNQKVFKRGSFSLIKCCRGSKAWPNAQDLSYHEEDTSVYAEEDILSLSGFEGSNGNNHYFGY